MTLLALLGASCEADGHPSGCGSTAAGQLDEVGGNSAVTVNGTAIADHSNVMHFPSHGHSYNEDDGCFDYQSHDLTPDQAPSVTINGQPVMRVGDSTTDPGSGGVADIVDAGGNDAITHTS